jgi:hypothetical protein
MTYEIDTITTKQETELFSSLWADLIRAKEASEAAPDDTPELMSVAEALTREMLYRRDVVADSASIGAGILRKLMDAEEDITVAEMRLLAAGDAA